MILKHIIQRIAIRRYFCSVKLIERPLILGIETSCDDTGAALLDRNGKIYGECLHSQQTVHLK